MILDAILLLPLAAAFLSRASTGRRLAPFVTVLSSAAAFLLAAGAAASAVQGGRPVGWKGFVELDGLGALLLLLVAFLVATAAICSVGYIGKGALHQHDDKKARSYYAHFNLFAFALYAVPVSVEPILAWIAVEFTALFSVLLVGFEGNREALEAAWKYIILMFMGAAIALLGFLLLFAAAQHGGATAFTWDGLKAATGMPDVLVKAAFLFVLIGFGAKSGIAPMHTWLPDAHSQAPSPICALLSGIKTTLALAVILRFIPLLGPSRQIEWFVVFGLLSLGMAAFLLLNVHDYKRMFAFSTVEHAGIIFTAAGLATAAGSAAAMAQILSHSLTKSFCFLAAGCVLMKVRTRDIASVRGLFWSSPGLAGLFVLGALAIGGAPPFAVFLSEFSVLRAALASGRWIVAGLLGLFIAIAFCGVTLHTTRMVFQRAPEIDGAPAPVAPLPPLPASCRLSLALAVAPVVALGLWRPGWLETLLQLSAGAITR